MTYGTANLEFLSACDDRFTQLIVTLGEYGRKLLEAGHAPEAETVLRAAVASGSDIAETYLLLADIYLASGEEASMRSLRESARQLRSPRRDAVLNKLEEKIPS